MILSSTSLGLLLSNNLKTKICICSELSKLCDELSVDLNYNVTPVIRLFDEKISNKSHLKFISTENIKSNALLNSNLSRDENRELSSFLYSLGKSDVTTQLMLINGFKQYIELSKNQYKKQYEKYSKLYLCYGAFFGIALTVVLV